MKQKFQNYTLKPALLAASLLSSGAVQAFPGPLDLPPIGSPDIAVNGVSILFTPSTGSNPGTLSVTKDGTGGFSLDGDPLLSNSPDCYNDVGVKTYCYSLVVKTDPNPNNDNALLNGTLQILGGTDGKTTLLKGNITAFGVEYDSQAPDVAAFSFLLDVTSSFYNYGPRAVILLGGYDLTSGFPNENFSGIGDVDNKNVVPEPASLALFAGGGMVLFASKRRRVENMT